MGMGKNLLLLCFCLSFALWAIAGIQTPFLQLISCTQNPGNPLVNSTTSLEGPGGSTLLSSSSCGTFMGIELNLYTVMATIILSLVGVSTVILVLTQRFPDPYTLFAPASYFFLTALTFPIGMFNSVPGNYIPFELKLFIGGFFMLAYMISFVEFTSKGNF